MDNQNNGLPQGVITNNTVNTSAPAPAAPVAQAAPASTPAKTRAPKKKMNSKTILIVVVIIAVAIIGYSMMGGKKKLGKNMAGTTEEKKVFVEVDVGTEWGNKYASLVQNVYYDYEIDSFDVTFIDLDFKNQPEMIVQFYYKKIDRNVTIIYYVDQATKNINISKAFNSASVKMLYSLEDGYSDWYIYVQPVEKFGKYSKMTKVMAGTVYAADISCSNEAELNAFRNTYIESNYRPVFYAVKQNSFEKDFKTIYDRFDEYNSEIEKEKKRLDDEYRSQVKRPYDTGEYLSTGQYHLTFGAYAYYIEESQAASADARYSSYIITLNRDRTMDMNGTRQKFTYTSNLITLEDGTTIRIIDNDYFVLNLDGGVRFKCLDPYVDPNDNRKRTINVDDDTPTESTEEKKSE